MGNGSSVHALTYSPDSSTLIMNSNKIVKNGSHINLSGKVTNFEHADACQNKNLNEVVRSSESSTLVAIKKSEDSCIKRMQSFDKNIMVEIKPGNLKNISHKICQSHNRKLLNDIFDTVANLESSLRISRNLEFEHCLKYSTLISKNVKLHLDLQNAFKRNKTMLNLFRQNVGFGTTARLPRSLKREIQRTWHEKYDALLKENSQLKKAAESMQLLTKEKDSQIDTLQERLLNMADSLLEREDTIKNICIKYLTLKNRKDEQETLLRGTIITLQDTLQKMQNKNQKRH